MYILQRAILAREKLLIGDLRLKGIICQTRCYMWCDILFKSFWLFYLYLCSIQKLRQIVASQPLSMSVQFSRHSFLGTGIKPFVSLLLLVKYICRVGLLLLLYKAAPLNSCSRRHRMYILLVQSVHSDAELIGVVTSRSIKHSKLNDLLSN